MKTLKCKKTLYLGGVNYYIEGKFYNISSIDKNFYYVYDENGDIDFICKTNEPSYIYFNEVFYTESELRKLKIDMLLKKEA